MMLFTDLVCKLQKFKYLPSYWVSSIRNRDIMKCTIKIAMIFTRLIVYLLLKNYKIVLTLTAVIYFFKCNVLGPKCANSPISYTTNYCHFLPTVTTSYQLLQYFCQLLPTFATLR